MSNLEVFVLTNSSFRSGNELQLQLYMAQINLYHGFLNQCSEDLPMSDHSRNEGRDGGHACVTAATNAIMFTSTYLTNSQETNLTWSTAYTILISAVVLLVAISCTRAHSVKRSEMYGTLYIAVQVLQNTRYGDENSKKSYLDFLQVRI